MSVKIKSPENAANKKLTPAKVAVLDGEIIANIFPVSEAGEATLIEHLCGPLQRAAKDPNLDTLTRCWRVELDTASFRRAEAALKEGLVPFRTPYHCDFPTKAEAVSWVKANLSSWEKVNAKHIAYLLDFAERRLSRWAESQSWTVSVRGDQ